MTKALHIFAMIALAAAAASAEDGLRVGDEFAIAGSDGWSVRATPQVAYGGGQWLVVWRDGWNGKGGAARILAARVSADGKVLDAAGIALSPAAAGVQEYPKVAFGGGVFLVAWQDLANGRDYDVRAARISVEGKLLDATPIEVAAGPRNQALPDVASDGKGFLVAWQGLVGDDTAYRGFAAPVGADGAVGAAVETGASPQPKLAFNGTHYLAVFGGEGLRALRLAADGKPIERPKYPPEVVRSSKMSIFSLAAEPGAGWLVVTHRSPPDPWGWGGPGAMRCFTVTPDGRRDKAIPDEPSGNWDKLPNWLDVGGRQRTTWPWGGSAVAWDGRQFVAVWQRQHVGGPKKSTLGDSDLMAARVRGFKPVDAEPVPVAASADAETNPAVAAGEASRLLVAYERADAECGVRIMGRLLRTE